MKRLSYIEEARCLKVKFIQEHISIGECRVLVGKPEGKRPFGRPRRKWEDNIKTVLQRVGCGNMDWIELAQARERWWALGNAGMNLRVP